MKLFIIRHGQTVANINHVLQGRCNSKLTSKGISQTKEVALKLKNEEIDIIFSSPLKRNIKTANLINKELDVSIIIDYELIEVCYGEWDGLLKEIIKKEYPHKWKEKEGNKYSFIHPGFYQGIKGNSYKLQYKQIEQFFKKLKNTDYKNVLIISHLGFLRNCRKYFDKLSNDEVSKYNPKNDDILIYNLKNLIL